MAIKRFQRGSSTYACNVCKRLTRNTGDEGNSRLCLECWELAGISNEISDHGPLSSESFTKPSMVLDLLSSLKKKGVDIVAAWGDEDQIAEYVRQV